MQFGVETKKLQPLQASHSKVLQPSEDSSVLQDNLAALLGVCEISQASFFTCEMAPEASRSLLPTLGDIFH